MVSDATAPRAVGTSGRTRTDRRRFGVATLVGLFAIVILALSAADLRSRYLSAIADAQRSAANAADVLAEHTARTFEALEHTLDAAERLRQDAQDGLYPIDTAIRALRLLKRSTPGILAVVWTNDKGDLIAHSYEGFQPRQNIADLPFFVAHRDGVGGRFLIARPIWSLTTGRWFTAVSRRIDNPDGSFAGIVSVPLDPAYFSEVYRAVKPGLQGSVLLIRRDGVVLTREPFTDQAMQTAFGADNRIGKLLPGADAGSYEAMSPIDGIARVISFKAVPGFPLVVIITYARDEALKPFYDHARVMGPLVVALLAVLAVGGALVSRQRRALARQTALLAENEERYRSLVEDQSELVSLATPDGVLRFVNHAYAWHFAREPDDMVGRSLFDFVPEAMRAAVAEDLRRVCAAEHSLENQNQVVLPNRETRWIAWTNRAIRDAGGIVTAIHSVGRNIDERMAAEQRLKASEARERENSAALRVTLAHISQGLTMFDADDRLIVWNDRYIELYGMSTAVVRRGVTFTEIAEYRKRTGKLDSDVAELVAGLKRQLAEGHAVRMNLQLEDGRVIAVVSTPTDGGGWVATHEDITDRYRHEARISFMAHHDLLTGLANRACFEEKIDEAVARLRRNGEPFAVFMLDLDKFKYVNDTYGHPAGDQLLKETAQRLKTTLRETDVLARLGGDEFAIIQSPQVSHLDGAARLAERLVNIIAEPYDLDGHVATVGTSIGIAMAPEHASTADQLMKMADLALYAAKAAGRNGFKLFESEMLVETDSRNRLEAELRAAITQGQFELHYQAEIDVKTRRPAGFEALVRWRHPDRGLLSPDLFIPLAEETGLIVPLGEWVLQQACADAATWPSHLRVAVNLSPVQLARPDLLEIVLCVLADTGLAPERLEIEITETALFKADVDYAMLIRRLKSLGLTIALDDFGTGYSSLSYLTMFPFDKIKIDKSFTMNLTRRADCAAIVSAVLALGRGLDTETVAEGVETEQQFGILRASGVTYVQGYLFGRPAPASQLSLGVPPTIEPRPAAGLVPDDEQLDYSVAQAS